MDTRTPAAIAAFEIEARLLRWGDSSTAGRTITLELDPDAGEVHPFKEYLAGAKNGQRFRLLYAPIADDESSALPTVGLPSADDVRGILKESEGTPLAFKSVALAKETASKQLETFRRVAGTAPAEAPARSSTPEKSEKSERAKAAYRDLPPMKQAVQRAGMMCLDRQYWRFLEKLHGFAPGGISSEGVAAPYMHAELLIATRSDIGTYKEVYERFLQHEAAYKQFTGQMAEIR